MNMIRSGLLNRALLCLVTLSLLVGLSGGADDEAAPSVDAAPPQGAPICLERPEHWSALPDLAPGNELICSRYLRFQTADGRTINARMFLIEFHPRRVTWGDQVSDDAIFKRQAIPSRIACIGHEIVVDEGYAPDFDVPTKHVTPAGNCAYNVDLGAVQCFVRTAVTKPEGD